MYKWNKRIGAVRHFDTQRCCQFIEHNKWMQYKHKHITNVYKERTNFTAIEFNSLRNSIACAGLSSARLFSNAMCVRARVCVNFSCV